MNLQKNLFQSFIVAALYKFLNRKCKLMNLGLVFGISLVLFGLLDYLQINVLENFQSKNTAVDITGRIDHKIIRLTNEITIMDYDTKFLKFDKTSVKSFALTNNDNQDADLYRFKFINPDSSSYSNNAYVTNETIFVIKTNNQYLKVPNAGGNILLTNDIPQATKFKIQYKNQDSSYTEIGDEVYLLVVNNDKKMNLAIVENVLTSVQYKVGEEGTGSALESQSNAVFKLHNRYGTISENLTLSSTISKKEGELVYNLNENKIIEKINLPPIGYEDYNSAKIHYLDKNDNIIHTETTQITDATPITEINKICYKIKIIGSNIKPNTPNIEIYGESVYYSKLMEYPNIKNLFSNLIKKSDNKLNEYGSIEGSELPYVISDYSISMWININDANNQNKITLLNKNDCPKIELNKSNNNYYISVTSKLKGKETPDVPTVEIPNELLISNQDYNILTVYKNKIDRIFGWAVVSLKQSGEDLNRKYYLLNQSHKYYYELLVSSSVSVEEYATNNNLEIKTISSLNSYSERGSIETKNIDFTNPSIEVYLNGRSIKKNSFKENLIYNNNSRLEVGLGNRGGLNTDGFIGNIYGVKFANYALTTEEINDLSIRKTDNVIKYITTTTSVANNNKGQELIPLKKVPHIYLPSYSNVFTFGGWFRIDSEDLNISDDGKLFLLKKGNDQRSDFELSIAGYSRVSLNIGRTPVSAFDLELPIKTWMHLTYIYNKVSNELVFYVNGNSNSKYYANNENSKKIKSEAINIDTTYVPLQVGPFFGKTKDVFFANYALSDEQVLSVMGNHPDVSINNTVSQLFQKITSCQGIPFDLSMNPDSISAFDVKEYILKSIADGTDINSDNYKTELDSKFNLKTIKDNADGYKNPGPSFQKEEFKKDYQYCYINPFNPDSKGECAKSGQEGAEKKCLPLAPYRCPSQGTINDFDIRTHKDFYKYVKTDKVRPPLVMEKNAPLNKYNITMDELSKHKDFPVLRNQLLSNLDIPSLVDKIDNVDILKQIALSLNSNEKIDLGELIASTDNKGAIRQAASSLLSSSDSSLDEVISGLEPQQALNVLSKMFGNNQISTNNLLQLIKDSNELTAFIKRGLNEGSIQINDLLDGQSTNNLKQVILNKCGTYSLNEIPGAEEKVKNIIKSKGLLTVNEAERMQVDMNQYIRKDKIPCVGCKLK